MSLQNLRSSYPKLGRIPADEPRIASPFARNDALSVPAPPRGADADGATYRAELHQAAAGRDRAPGEGRADSGSGEGTRGLDKTLRHVDTGFAPTTSGAGPDNTLTTPGSSARRGRA